jgi:hypothetical protein
MKRNKRFLFGSVLIMFVALVVVPTLAQDKKKNSMEAFHEIMRVGKKPCVSKNIEMSDAEAKGFWPVYESYQKDLSLLDERLIKLIEEYARNYGAMTDEVAKKLLDDSLDIEADRLKLRQTYLPKFRRVIPEKKVVLYYQLENKAQAAVNYELAEKIPLVQ